MVAKKNGLWFHAVITVLKKPQYVLLALSAAYFLLLVASWLPNRALLGYIFRSDAFNTADRLQFLLNLRGLTISATALSLSLLIATAILTGINVALIVYYIRTRAAVERAAGVTAIGIVGSLVGVGCASCGSVILTSFFGFAASTSIVGFLPFRGLEFAAGGLSLVGFATYTIARKIAAPLAC